VESNVLEDSNDGEDLYPYPIPHDLAKFFAEPDDFVPRVKSMDSTSDSSGNTFDVFNVQPEQEESNHSLKIEYIYKNIEEEGEWVPITLREFYNISPCSTDSKEYEFDSLPEATTEKDIDQVHVYKSQLKVMETSRVMSNKSKPTSFFVSSVDIISTLRDSNTPMDKISLGLDSIVHAFDDYTMNAIEPTTTLSLTYLELID